MDYPVEEIVVKVEILGDDDDENYENEEENIECNQFTYNQDYISIAEENHDVNESAESVNAADASLNRENVGGNETEGFHCLLCQRKFKSRANVRAHIRHIHSDDYYVQCTKCDRAFKSHAHLKSHVDCAHPRPGTEVECDVCGKVFINKKKLSNHKYYTHATPEEKVTCAHCNKVFMKKYKLNVHIRQVHSLDRVVDCEYCGKQFKNGMLLKRHVTWSHPGDSLDFECDECGKKFPSDKHCLKHKKNTHSLPLGMECDICKAILANRKTLVRHMKVHNEGRMIKKVPKVGSFPCAMCDRKCTSNTALYWHMEKDHSEYYSPMKSCHICSKDFSDQHTLRRHLESVHSIETATCTICNKTFKSPINLESHMRTTHAPPEAAKTCKICKKKFKCALHLRMHISAVHEKKDEVSCDICNRSFTSKKQLASHKKTHVMTRDFQCHVCKKFYKNKNDLNKHLKYVHKFKPPKSKCLLCHEIFKNDKELSDHLLCCPRRKDLPVVKVEGPEE